MGSSAVKDLDQAFLSILDEMLSNIIQVSEDAANEILDTSSAISSESVQPALQSFQELYQSDNQINQIKYDYNREIDDLINQVNLGVDVSTSSSSANQSAGEHLAEIQKRLEYSIKMDKELRAEIAPVIVGMQFAETTSQHLTGLSNAWKYVTDQVNAKEHSEKSHVFQKIEGVLRTPIEINAFYKRVLKSDPPESTCENDLCDWIDALFEEGV